jgi:hypothetical protein
MLAGSSGLHSLGDAWIQFLTIHVDSAGMLSVALATGIARVPLDSLKPTVNV